MNQFAVLLHIQYWQVATKLYMQTRVFFPVMHWSQSKIGRHFADILKCISLNENAGILINISLWNVTEGPIINKSIQCSFLTLY